MRFTFEQAMELAAELLGQMFGYSGRCLPLVFQNDQKHLAKALIATYQRGVLQDQLQVNPKG